MEEITLGLEREHLSLSQALFVFHSSHNDFVLQLRILYQNRISRVNLRELNTTHTNLVKLQAGYVGAQVCTAVVVGLRTYFYICFRP